MAKNKLDVAAEELEKLVGVYVGSAYGYPSRVVKGSPENFLIVWTDEKKPNVPATFQGYKVAVRGIPKAL